MTKTTAPKKFCFVLMPFSDDFKDVYELGIKQSCIDAGAYCERVDEQIYHNESIVERIYNQISKADILIADMTGRNPNVFYEVGYAHALGKRTILLTKDVKDIPFDLQSYPHIIYNNQITKLKEELTKKVKWYVENDDNIDIDDKIGLDIYLGSENLSVGNVVYITPPMRLPNPILTIYNNSLDIYNPADYRIGIITDGNYRKLENKESKTIVLPNGKRLHLLQYREDILYPDFYSTFGIALYPNKSEYQEEQQIIIRLFTSVGTRDYSLIIKYSQA